MREESNWINQSKDHFENIHDGEVYISGDVKSTQSKKISEQLKNYLKENIKDEELILNAQGNKWAKQGHKKLKNYIWYHYYLKNLGKDYPIVLNISINKDGLNISIDIYESRLPDKNLQDVLLTIVRKIVKETCDIDAIWNQNNDYGYFGLDTPALEKLNNMLHCYKKVVCYVNQEIFSQMIEEYNKASTSSLHCQITDTDEHYSIRKNLKGLVDDFLSEPTKEKFEIFWNRGTINSAQQASNATNLLKKSNIEIMASNIKKLIYLDPNDEEIIKNIKEQIPGAKNSALEFYYYYRMGKDDFPLINGGIENAINVIEKNCINLDGKVLNEKMLSLKEQMKNR